MRKYDVYGAVRLGGAGIQRRKAIGEMRTKILIVLMAVIASAVAGCGNRGAMKTILTTGNGGRTSMRVGDKVTYTVVSGTKIGPAETPIVVSGSLGKETVEVLAGDGRGHAVPRGIVSTYEIRTHTEQRSGGRTRDRSLALWCGVDSKGNLYLLGHSINGAAWGYVTDQTLPLMNPSQISPGQSWLYVAHFGNGDVESFAFRCVGVESIDVGGVRCSAFKIAEQGSYSGLGASGSGFLWLSPSLPSVFEVKSQFECPIGGEKPIGGASSMKEIRSVELSD